MTDTKTPREQQLEHIIDQIWWMARRYAHNRSSYAVSQYNACIAALIEAGIDIKPIMADGSVWAKDYDLGWPDTLIEKYGRHNAANAEEFNV